MKTDGTVAGTIVVKNIFGDNADMPTPLHLANVGGTLFFNFTNGPTGYELWESNGTEAGTVLVKDIATGNRGAGAAHLVALNGVVYFSAAEQALGELWRTDGTTAGTWRVRGGVGGSYLTVSNEIIRVGEKLIFKSGTRLWQTDGTDAGTTIVEESFVGFRESAVVGAKLYFIRTGLPTDELWSYDSVTGVTALVKDIYGPPSYSWSPSGLTNVNGTLMFAANGSTGGMDLWKSDGSAAGTVLVKRLPNLGNVPGIEFMANANGTLYFVGEDNELWKSDGTETGTMLVKRIDDATGHGTIAGLTPAGGTVYLSANDGSGYELWKSDGSAAGTLRVKDIRPGASSSAPSNLTAIGSQMFFTANDGSTGIELWASDGTEAGTSRLSNFATINPSPRNFIVERGILYFAADESPGFNAWASDGTIAGTRPLVDDFGLNLSTVRMAFVGKTLFFSGFSTPYGTELWKLQLPSAAGDYDSNGAVDGADFLAWQRAFGTAASPAGSGADGDGNGTVGNGDLGVWKTNFGAGNSTAATAAALSEASEFSAAALVADEEPAEFVVGDGEELGSEGVGNAADAAFAWLAGDRSEPNRGHWRRSAAEAELFARDWAARSGRPTSKSLSDFDGALGSSGLVRKIRRAEMLVGDPAARFAGDDALEHSLDALAEQLTVE
jgi:ELWxxDGT repeat protein